MATDMLQNNAFVDRCVSAAAATEGDLPAQFPPPLIRVLLPYLWADDLIPTLDAAACFPRRAEGRLSRPGIRRGGVARIAESSLGARAGVVRATHPAFLARPLRYGHVTCGSGEFGVGVRKLEVLRANIPARPISGIGRPA